MVYHISYMIWFLLLFQVYLFYQQNQQIEIKVTRNQDQPFSIQIHLEANKGNKGNKCKSNNSYQK